MDRIVEFQLNGADITLRKELLDKENLDGKQVTAAMTPGQISPKKDVVEKSCAGMSKTAVLDTVMTNISFPSPIMD